MIPYYWSKTPVRTFGQLFWHAIAKWVQYVHILRIFIDPLLMRYRIIYPTGSYMANLIFIYLFWQIIFANHSYYDRAGHTLPSPSG